MSIGKASHIHFNDTAKINKTDEAESGKNADLKEITEKFLNAKAAVKATNKDTVNEYKRLIDLINKNPDVFEFLKTQTVYITSNKDSAYLSVLNHRNEKQMLLPPDEKLTASQFVEYMQVAVCALDHIDKRDIQEKYSQAAENFRNACYKDDQHDKMFSDNQNMEIDTHCFLNDEGGLKVDITSTHEHFDERYSSVKTTSIDHKEMKFKESCNKRNLLNLSATDENNNISIENNQNSSTDPVEENLQNFMDQQEKRDMEKLLKRYKENHWHYRSSFSEKMGEVGQSIKDMGNISELPQMNTSKKLMKNNTKITIGSGSNKPKPQQSTLPKAQLLTTIKSLFSDSMIKSDTAVTRARKIYDFPKGPNMLTKLINRAHNDQNFNITQALNQIITSKINEQIQTDTVPLTKTKTKTDNTSSPQQVRNVANSTVQINSQPDQQTGLLKTTEKQLLKKVEELALAQKPNQPDKESFKQNINDLAKKIIHLAGREKLAQIIKVIEKTHTMNVETKLKMAIRERSTKA